jgi:hypothetical protein
MSMYVIYAVKASTTVNVPIFTKLTKAQQNYAHIQWKPLIMITLGPALCDNSNRLITLSRGYKDLHNLTHFIVTTFYMYKNIY